MARIVLVDRTSDEKAPALVVHLTDATLAPLTTLKVDDKGNVDLKEDALKEAAYVAIAAADEKSETLSRDAVVLLRARHVAELLRGNGTIELARGRWERLWPLRRCVTGRVRACRWPFPWFTDLLAPNLPARAGIRAAAADTLAPRVDISRFAPGLATDLIFPRRCYAVCEGVVEVYLRRCCWRPIVVFDPRIDEIIRELERIPIPIPDPDPGPIGPDPIGPFPGPGPDPAPFLRGGVPDELLLNAGRDLVALRSLPPAEQAAYIEARPYFRRFFRCGTPRLVGSGFLQPDGEFQVCWRSFPFITPIHCHDQVAYVVKQLVNGTTITIYDGRAAGQWFGLGETPTLTTYDRRAITCRGGDTPPVPGAAVFLELIGSHREPRPRIAGAGQLGPRERASLQQRSAVPRAFARGSQGCAPELQPRRHAEPALSLQ